MPALDQTDLDNIAALISPTEAKVDAANSSLTALQGSTAALSDNVDAIGAQLSVGAVTRLPPVHISSYERSNARFNALHDVPSLSAHWNAERGDLVYSDQAGTIPAVVGGFVKGWRDQVNGWLASQVVPTDNITFELTDGFAGVASDATTYSGLDIEAAGGVLFQNRPFSYVFIAHKYADEAATQYALAYSATGTTGVRRVGCALNNNGPKIWSNGRRIGADPYFNAFDRSGLVHGTWSIGTYAFEWSTGIGRVRSNLNDYEAVVLDSTGNSEDGASGRMRIHSGIGTNAGGGVRGPIGEIIVSNPTTIMPDSVLNDIAAGLMAKWGVA